MAAGSTQLKSRSSNPVVKATPARYSSAAHTPLLRPYAKSPTDRLAAIRAIEPDCPPLKAQPALRRGAEERGQRIPAERVSDRVCILRALELCVASWPSLG
jgi:hypothetical protein